MKFNIKKHNLTDIINLKFGVYNPLKEFTSKEEFLKIVYHLKTNENKFFPFPIFLNISSKINKKIKNKNKLSAYYNSTKVCELEIKSIYELNKIDVGRKIFNTKDINHPGFKHFIKTEKYFLQASIINFNNKILKKIKFIKPFKIKSEIHKKKLKTIAGFHTRNAPHKGHEWIHSYGLKKCGGLLIQPMIGQYKKYEYKDSFIVKSNLKIIKKFYKNKKILFSLYNSYPKYGGHREAMLHALVRKNYGCSHFLIGRDHAGVKNYYKKYDSQKICKKYEKKLGIKILIFNEPYLCKTCKKIVNKKKHGCKKNFKIPINGTYIRSRLRKKLNIPEELMRAEISNILNKQSIIEK